MNQELLDSFHYGHCTDAYKIFGAHLVHEDVSGVRFTVWAPNASAVEVIGSFNDWNGYQHRMEKVSDRGIYSLFVPRLTDNYSYKYRIYTFDGQVKDKSDPYAFYSELRPSSGSIIYKLDGFKWADARWLKKRTKNFDKPVNIYEVHLGSWRKNGHYWYNYTQFIDELIPYVKDNGFTHIELMPLIEHPFDGSWGYQAYGYFSATSRYGTPKDLMKLINECHKHNIGVILDMVPVHYVKDDFGLRYFDGTPLYEYPNSHDAESEWGTMNFDLWKEEVRSFLMSATAFWCDYFHVDGIRMDAVKNLIYWGGNSDKGVNEGALAFIRRLNYHISTKFPGVMLIAEDSSDFPKVTHSTIDGGLGFDYKWDLGWMNDTLKYFKKDPIFRKHHHHDLTFSMAYFYSERFLLPLSHDEVVHGKKTIIDRMWGNYDQKFAQAKTLYVYMLTHPGKKLNFMGNELAMFREWDEDRPCDWSLLGNSRHASFLRFFKDMSFIYTSSKAMFEHDFDYQGFQWIDADNVDQSIYSYYREDEDHVYVTVLNMLPVSYEHFTLGVPYQGEYVEIMNTEKDIYEGCNMCNYFPLYTNEYGSHHLPYSINIRLAPFSGIVFRLVKEKPVKRRGRKRKEVV